MDPELHFQEILNKDGSGPEPQGLQRGRWIKESGMGHGTDSSWNYKIIKKLQAKRSKQKIQKLPGKEQSTYQSQLNYPQASGPWPGGPVLFRKYHFDSTAPGPLSLTVRNKIPYMHIFSGRNRESTPTKTTPEWRQRSNCLFNNKRKKCQ